MALPAPAEPARKRGRPKGISTPRVKTVKFDINEAVDAMSDLAANTFHPGWEWHGKSYPKTKTSHGPNMEALNMHLPLKKLVALAPNGYPDPYKLRDLFIALNTLYRIFENRADSEKHLSVNSLCMLAADRWRIMCKHAVMLAKSQAYIPRNLEHLQDVISSLRLGEPPAVPAAASSNAAEKPPVEPTLQMWLTQPVPYTNGVIDWEKLEDELPIADSADEFELEIVSLDFSKPQSSHMHPYYHQMPDNDCCIVSHKCNCEKCREAVVLESPERRRCKRTVETLTVEASPARPDESVAPPTPTFGTQSTFEDTLVLDNTPRANSQLPELAEPARVDDGAAAAVPGSPPPLGNCASENFLDHVEHLANTAEMPATAAIEKQTSSKEKGEKRKRVAPQPKKRIAKKSKPILPVAGTTEETVDGDSPGTAVPATAQDPSPDKKKKGKKKTC